jgi:DNA-binding response OmpR family regulator
MKAPARIVCIEDEPDLREDLVLELSEAGYDALGFADGISGLAAVRELKPALVICDIQLPRYSGLDLLRKLTASEARNGGPAFILLSAYSDPATRQQAAELGVTRFLVKPVDYADLLVLVEGVLKGKDKAG